MGMERLRAREDVDAFTAQNPAHLLGDVRIFASHDVWAGLNDRHPAAEATIGLRHFDAGVAATQDDKVRRQVIQFEGLDMGQRARFRQTGNIGNGGMRSDIDHKLVAEKHASAASIQYDLDGFRADEAAAAHDELGTGFLIGIQMKRDLAIDHVLLTAAHPAHIRRTASASVPKRAAFRTTWATLALHNSFLEGMQATAGQEPPTQRRSTTATLLPDLARCQASSFPPWPLPRMTVSKISG